MVGGTAMAEAKTLSMPREEEEWEVAKEMVAKEDWTAAVLGAGPHGFSRAVQQANRPRRATGANASAPAYLLCAPVAEAGSAAAVAPVAAEAAAAAAAVAMVASATAAATVAPAAAVLLESPPGSSSE